MFLEGALLKSTTVQAISRVKITKYQFYNMKLPKLNTGPDPSDPSDPSDLGRELLLETYQPSRAGVEMTAVLNKLSQIRFSCPIRPSHRALQRTL